jgi:hypothetical protein
VAGSDLARAAPKLNQNDDTTQVAALPLDSWLKTDPWDDKELMLSAKRYAPIERSRQDALRTDG